MDDKGSNNKPIIPQLQRLAWYLYNNISSLAAAFAIAGFLGHFINLDWRGALASIFGVWNTYVRPGTQALLTLAIIRPCAVLFGWHITISLLVRDYVSAGLVLVLQSVRSSFGYKSTWLYWREFFRRLTGYYDVWTDNTPILNRRIHDRIDEGIPIDRFPVYNTLYHIRIALYLLDSKILSQFALLLLNVLYFSLLLLWTATVILFVTLAWPLGFVGELLRFFSLTEWANVIYARTFLKTIGVVLTDEQARAINRENRKRDVVLNLLPFAYFLIALGVNVLLQHIK